MNVVKCAIYTRKSTDEGLNKEFNTLEAQREAGENYVLSQRHQGWECLPTHYDDGGYSGGTLERPALQRLLCDIENGLVNMIVIYKIDRLTRSLTDFAKLIEVLDRNHCSFVSVTQNFNTYDSMGRLMLNVLLSFAQFEREVSAERTRDKVAASKKKGMWMGGLVPFGYQVINKKLTIVENDAEIVRLAFEKYLILRSEVGVANWLNAQGYKMIVNKQQTEFNHFRVSSMLKNILYIGKIKHKENVYEGQHEAIISQELFDAVQKIKNKNRIGRLTPSRFMEHALLKGLLECECCHSAMVSTKSNKQNKVYEYYTSVHAVKEGFKKCEVGTIPAAELDNFVLKQLAGIIKSPKIVAGLIDKVKLNRPDINDTQVIGKIKNSENFIQLLSATMQRQLIELLIKKVRVNVNRIKICYSNLALNLMDNETKGNLMFSVDGLQNEILYPVELHRKRGSVKIFAPLEYKSEENNPLFVALIKAFNWQERIKKEKLSIEELAKKEDLSREYVGKVLKMTYLAPDIVSAIIEGVYPKSLSITQILESEIPLLWSKQRLKYGFTA